jgi:preprotein translocase subunit SecG
VVALLIALNIIAALFLIAVVLLQSGKGADMGAAFGGASSTVFGASGAGNLLTKLTAASAAVFMLTSLALAVLGTRQRSIFDSASEPSTYSAPAVPAPAASDNAAPAASDSNAAAPAASDSNAAAAAPTGEAAKDLGPAGQAAGANTAQAPAAPAEPAANAPAAQGR